MKLVGLIALGVLVLLAFWMMYGERKPKRKEPGADSNTWLWQGDTSPGDGSEHHHSHHSDAGGDGGFGGGDGGGHH